MGTCKLVPQIKRPQNLRLTEKIVTVKFRGLSVNINISQQMYVTYKFGYYALWKEYVLHPTCPQSISVYLFLI